MRPRLVFHHSLKTTYFLASEGCVCVHGGGRQFGDVGGTGTGIRVTLPGRVGHRVVVLGQDASALLAPIRCCRAEAPTASRLLSRFSHTPWGEGRRAPAWDIVAIRYSSEVWGCVQATGARISKDPPALNDTGVSKGHCRERGGVRHNSLSRTRRMKRALTLTSSSASEDPPAALPTSFVVLSWCHRMQFPATLLNRLPRGSAPGMPTKVRARRLGMEAGPGQREEDEQARGALLASGRGPIFKQRLRLRVQVIEGFAAPLWRRLARRQSLLVLFVQYVCRS